MQPDDKTIEDRRLDAFRTASGRPRSVYDAISERYDIVKELGAGGMGVVLHVFDRLTEQDVALKLIRPELARRRELVDRFKREVRLARQITHKRVCRTHELLRFGDTFAISMEYIDGDTLRELLRRLGGLGPRTVIRIADEICSALQEAHSEGIIHRDLKPENIMLDREGHVKVMDFGIAHSSALADTAPGAVLGTPCYMAPEQASGGQIDPRTDIYLFGLLLYEMHTGTAVGEDLRSRRVAHIVREHSDVIPESAAQVIIRCLQQEPSARFQSASDVAIALRVGNISVDTSNISGASLGVELFEIASVVEEELMGLNSNLEGPCTRTETWRRLPKFLEEHRVITASTARSLELFRSIAAVSTKWQDWSESKVASTMKEGQALIGTLRAIPTPEFTIERVDIPLFQDESCTTPLPQPLGVRVNIRYSDGSNAPRLYPAGKKFRVGDQVRPRWETRHPFTRLYYRDSSGNPVLAWDFAFSFKGFVIGAAATQGQ